jgi:hypothetical protein
LLLGVYLMPGNYYLVVLAWIDNEVMQLTIGEHLARIGVVSVAVFNA